MKKVKLMMTLMMCLVMAFSFSQEKSYSGTIEPVLSYGDNDIWSFGVRNVVEEKLVFDVIVGSTFNNYNNDSKYSFGETKSKILIGKVGVGTLITKDFLIGLNYQLSNFSEKTKNYSNWDSYKTEDNIKHNFGLFCAYYINNIGINYSTNSITGNSIGISVRLKD